MDYARLMLMAPFCMRIGTKICDCLLMGRMVDNSSFRFIFFISNCEFVFLIIV